MIYFVIISLVEMLFEARRVHRRIIYIPQLWVKCVLITMRCVIVCAWSRVLSQSTRGCIDGIVNGARSLTFVRSLALFEESPVALVISPSLSGGALVISPSLSGGALVISPSLSGGALVISLRLSPVERS